MTHRSALAIALLLSIRATAQDTAGYRLVFEDSFDGDTLNREAWHSYGIWAGMESDNWQAGRCDVNTNAIYRDANVRMAGGLCTLSLRSEETAWRCDTCRSLPYRRSFTTGVLHSYYTRMYRYGRFEARIRMPVDRGLHATFWLWPAEADQDVPEFDIAEGYGGRLWPTPFAQYNPRFTNFSIHRWGPGGHREKKGRYPRQRWINKLLGNHFDQSQWHTYRLDWEPDAVRFYLDGRLVRQYVRYYRRRLIGRAKPAAKATPGKTFTPFWFPPETIGCNIRFTLAIDDTATRPPGLVGEMLIDHVRVWQRGEP